MRLNCVLVAGCVLAGLLVASRSDAVMIDFAPASAAVALGDSFAVDVVVSGLLAAPGGEVVSAFDLDVLYDSSILSATGFHFSDGLGLPGIDAFTNVAGTVGRIDFASVSLLDSIALFGLQGTDSLVLGQLLFDTVGIGRSALTFDTLVAPGILLVGADPFGSLPIDSFGAGQIDVLGPVSVDEPGTLWLAMAGAGLMAMISRRRRAQLATR